MFGLFAGKKTVQKLDLNHVSQLLARRFWQYEKIKGRSDVIVVNGKYSNHQKTFQKLFVYFVGGNKVQFKDERGVMITHVPANVEQEDLFPQIKNILNVL